MKRLRLNENDILEFDTAQGSFRIITGKHDTVLMALGRNMPPLVLIPQSSNVVKIYATRRMDEE